MYSPKHTQGIVISRINFGENDRIITIISKDYGKLKAIAKGVRKERSKLAGGIELFGISNFGFIAGKGEMATIVSTKLEKHYSNFLKDLDRVNFAYDCFKKINKITDDNIDENYFLILKSLLETLDDKKVPLAVIGVWWCSNLTKMTGHKINTEKTLDNKNFKEDAKYVFDTGSGGFIEATKGSIGPSHIKYLRLAINNPNRLTNVKDGEKIAKELLPTLKCFIEYVH
jgi:DNA repair protein RecO (recombination protein O)